MPLPSPSSQTRLKTSTKHIPINGQSQYMVLETATSHTSSRKLSSNYTTRSPLLIDVLPLPPPQTTCAGDCASGSWSAQILAAVHLLADVTFRDACPLFKVV